MNGNEGYDDWANYETWLVSMWLNNEQGGYEMLQEICCTEKSNYQKADDIEELVRELYCRDEKGMTADLVNAAIGRVDFIEIARTTLE